MAAIWNYLKGKKATVKRSRHAADLQLLPPESLFMAERDRRDNKLGEGSYAKSQVAVLTEEKDKHEEEGFKFVEQKSWLEEAKKPLPSGWEVQQNKQGRTFFVDHVNRRTQWNRPTTNEAAYFEKSSLTFDQNAAVPEYKRLQRQFEQEIKALKKKNKALEKELEAFQHESKETKFSELEQLQLSGVDESTVGDEVQWLERKPSATMTKINDSYSVLCDGIQPVSLPCHEDSEIEVALSFPVQVMDCPWWEKDEYVLGKVPETISSGSRDSQSPEEVPVLPGHAAHESVLLDKCFIPFGIKTVQIDQFGGVYCLEPTTGKVEDHSDDSEQQRIVTDDEGDDAESFEWTDIDDDDDDNDDDDDDDEGTGSHRKSRDNIADGREEEIRFQIEVPDGALKQEFLEVHSAIIFSGPWRLPEGYTLASPVLYISFDFTAVTKPIIVRVPHWIAQVWSLRAEDCPLAIAPHDLPEDDSKYTFSFLDQEDCSVSVRYSTIKLSGHCCLVAQAIKESAKAYPQSRYCATAWTKPACGDMQSGFIFRVLVVLDLPIWNDVVEQYCGRLHNWTLYKQPHALSIDFQFRSDPSILASLSNFD